MNEAETRAELIDPALTVAGWGVVQGSRIRREYLISPGRIEGRARRVGSIRSIGVEKQLENGVSEWARERADAVSVRRSIFSLVCL